VPYERIVVTTAGDRSGSPQLRRRSPGLKTVSKLSPRDELRMIEIAPPKPEMKRTGWLSFCAADVSGVSLSPDRCTCARCATSVRPPVEVDDETQLRPE